MAGISNVDGLSRREQRQALSVYISAGSARTPSPE